MKTLNLKVIGFLVIVTGIFTFSSCDEQLALEDVLLTQTDSIDADCCNSLVYMREEEKLAHDVYINMFDLWGVKIFENISKSETQHTEKVLSLLNLYGLEDPVLPDIGEFSNKDLQALYNQLMQQGSDSLVAALIVGATIEEVDILDLFERMEQTEKQLF